MKVKLTGIFLLFILACNEQPANNNSPVVLIDKGDMPAIASDKNKAAHLVYGFGERLMYTASNDKGKSFSSPELVDVVPALVASATRGPQIAATKDGVVIVAVDEAGDVFSYIKDKSGKWIKTGRVNDADTTDKEGFVGLSSDNENNLFAIWTDLRGDHQNKIFGARSNDGGRTWMKNILVYASPSGTICDCCKPSVVMKANNVFVMFRNWLNGNRDLYLIKSTDAGESFGQAQKLGKGNWALNACPMDGGGLAVSETGDIQTVWRRASKIYTCEPGTDEKQIGEGKSCTIESVNGKNIYAWTEGDDVTCLLPDGSTKVLGKGSLPILKSVSNSEVICVWQNEGDINSSLIHL
jgi:hypothetical protein